MEFQTINGKAFTPREVVGELDRYIIGQEDAKRCVAIALRNRWRRQQVTEDLRDEIIPKNIIMIGPTGVGKSEIARRLARLAQAPFIKVEASKYTEVGYVGRDVDSMIRDLTEISVNMVKAEEMASVKVKAQELAEERLLDLLLPKSSSKNFEKEDDAAAAESAKRTRDKLRQMLRNGAMDDRFIELETQDKNIPMVEIFSSAGMEEMDINIKDMFGNLFPKRTKRRKVKVPEAIEIITHEESQKLIDMEKVTKEAVRRAEQAGIVFIDELDKIAGREKGHGPDVSREGVQRDILPLIEGSAVNTKYGIVKTNHILFIAAGAFHVSKPTDLIPELQGRFPIRVELHPLNEEHFVKILKEPKNSLVKQHIAMMETEKVHLNFMEDGIREIARIAALVNQRMENIGARRLHTVIEKVIEEISFKGPELPDDTIKIDSEFVRDKLKDILTNEDLSRYIL